MSETLPVRMSLPQKIARLQISEPKFDFYCTTFIKYWGRYRLKKENSDWYLVKNRTGIPVRLIKHIVADHLLGKYWVSTFPPEIARHICIDIDHSPEQASIYRGIKDWLKSPLTFQSSENGGLHVYAFLSPGFPIRWDKLFSLTQFQLRKRDINIKPGLCEVPLNPNSSIRLPLGRESSLIDPERNTPLSLSLGETLDLISLTIKYFTFEDLFPGLKRVVK